MAKFYGYVDLTTNELRNFVVKPAHAHVAATTNQALSGLRLINGAYTIVDNDVILLTAQTTTSENGLWRTHTGAWNRHERWPTGSTYPD